MAAYLSSHPEVFMARKEMHCFGSDLSFGPQFYRRDLDNYLEEYRSWNGERRGGDASVWYLFSRNAAAEIHAFNPQARILIMLREPVEMMHSLFYQFRFDGNEPLMTFAEALAAEDGRRAGRHIWRHTYFAQGLIYRDAARYTDQVRRYFDVFGRQRVNVIIYDDFAADAAGAYRKVLDFLEVDSAGSEREFEVINGNKSARSPALRAVLRNPRLCSMALKVRPWLPRPPVFSALQYVDERLRRSNSRPMARAPLDPELRRRLKQEFAPEIVRLSELLGRDLTGWST